MDVTIFVHLVGAGALFVLIPRTFVDLWTGKREVLRTRALQIGGLFLVQVGSGSALALASDTANILAYCSNMGLYIALVAVAEAALYGALTRTAFPMQSAYAMVAVALVVMTGTVIAL